MAGPDLKALQSKYQPKSLKVLNINQQLCSIRFSPDGKTLIGGTFEATVRRWDFSTATFDELPALKGHNGWVQAVAFHPDTKRLFSADSWGRICCWLFAEREPKPIWSIQNAHDGWIHGAAVSPDGNWLASCGRDQLVKVWSADSGENKCAFKHSDHVLAIAFHPAGKSLVSGDSKGVIREWDLAARKPVRELDARAMHVKDRIQDVGGVRCLTFDPAGKTLVAGGAQPKTGGFVTGSNLILAFDWLSGKVKHTLKGTNENEVYVLDLAFHPDGFLMAVSSGQPGNGKLIFQRLEDAQPFVTVALPNCHSLALQPGGSRLVVTATNANSSGNGRVIGKNKDYPGNYSPLHVFEFPRPTG